MQDIEVGKTYMVKFYDWKTMNTLIERAMITAIGLNGKEKIALCNGIDKDFVINLPFRNIYPIKESNHPRTTIFK